MPLNFGRLLQSAARAGGPILDERLQRRELAEKETQRRTLEEALAKRQATQDAALAQSRTLDDELKRVQIDKARAPTPAAPERGSPEALKIIADETRTRAAAAPPQAPREQAGAADRRAQHLAAQETLDLLDAITKDVEAGGTDVDPRSARRAGLASNYAQFQLKLKDAAKLGALSQSDLDIMLNALNDPTSAKARALSLGSPETHRAKVLAGSKAVRESLLRNIARLSGGEAAPKADASAIRKKYGLDP